MTHNWVFNCRLVMFLAFVWAHCLAAALWGLASISIFFIHLQSNRQYSVYWFQDWHKVFQPYLKLSMLQQSRMTGNKLACRHSCLRTLRYIFEQILEIINDPNDGPSGSATFCFKRENFRPICVFCLSRQQQNQTKTLISDTRRFLHTRKALTSNNNQKKIFI